MIRRPSANLDTALRTQHSNSSSCTTTYIPYKLYNTSTYSHHLSDLIHNQPIRHPRLWVQSSKAPSTHTLPSQPSNKSSAKLHPHEPTGTSTTANHPLPVSAIQELQLLLSEFLHPTLDALLDQLPHKSHRGVLPPFPGEDSARSRHQSLVRLGFAPFKPP